MKIMNSFFRKKAQAMVELAILGPILLMALGIIATYVAKLNSDQWMLMSAFRNALVKAHDNNQIASYGTYDDRRMVSAVEPIIGQKIGSSGAGYVHWSINDVTEGGDPNPDSQTYVKINAIEYPVQGGGGVEPTYFTYKGSKVDIKTEGERVTSTRSGGVGEVMIYKVGEQYFFQGRGHGASRTFSGGGSKDGSN